MKASFKIGFLFFCITLLESCVFQPGGGAIYMGEKDSCGFAVNQYSGQGLRWDEDEFPISFYVHHSVPEKAKANFMSAVSHWNLAWADYLEDQGLKVFPLFMIRDKNNLYSGKPGKDNSNFLFFIEDRFSRYESNSNTQAITAITSSGYEIKDTDILINAESFTYYYDKSYNKEITLAENKQKERRSIASSRAPSFKFKVFDQLKKWLKFFLKPFIKKNPRRTIATPSPKVPKDKVDFPSLIIHELGHVPGMAHFNESDINEDHNHYRSRSRGSSRAGSYLSVMEPRLSSGRARRQVTEHDLDNLFCAYFNY